MDKHKPDLIFYEYYTGDCTAFIEKYKSMANSQVNNMNNISLNENNILMIIENILNKIRKKNIYLVFLNLFRDDIVVENTATKTYDKLSEYYNIPYINLHRYLYHENIDHTKYFNDMCHCNELGNVFYAKTIYNFCMKIINNNNNLIYSNLEPLTNVTFNDKFIKLIEERYITNFKLTDILNFESSCFNYEYVILNDINNIHLQNVNFTLKGILLITFPFSNNLIIETENDKKIISTIDQYSYYNRILNYNLDIKVTKFLKISNLISSDITNEQKIIEKPYINDDFIEKNIVKIIGIFISN